MISVINKIHSSIDCLSECLGRLMAWLTIAMVVLMAAVVVLRYGFDIGLIAIQESVIYLHACIFLMGSGYALKHNEHVRIDIFYRKLSEQGQALVNVFGHLFLLLPVVFFIAYMSWEYVMDAWSIKESSVEVGGLPFVYLLKSLLLLFCLSLGLQGVAETLKAVCVLKSKGNSQTKDNSDSAGGM